MGGISGGKQTTAADGDYGGYLTLWTTSGGANGEANSGSYERMRIDSAGDVGIRNTNPSAFNSLGGRQVVIGDGTQTNTLTFYSATTGGSGYGQIAFADSNTSSSTAQYAGLIQYYHGDNSMAFYTGSTKRMTIDSTGRLAVGGTATSGSTGGVTISSASSGYRHMYIWNSGLYFWNGSNEANLSSGGAWNNASDERLKENIVDIPYGLSEIKQLQPKKYTMITGGEEQVGLIAQEVESIIPEVVTTSGEANMKSLSYGNLNAVLIKALQEQQTIIDDLKSRIEALEE